LGKDWGMEGEGVRRGGKASARHKDRETREGRGWPTDPDKLTTI
jgi:hypothetical protein